MSVLNKKTGIDVPYNEKDCITEFYTRHIHEIERWSCGVINSNVLNGQKLVYVRIVNTRPSKNRKLILIQLKYTVSLFVQRKFGR